MPPTQTRSFVIGETVHLRVRVSKPGTRTPTDADVVLTSLRTGAAVIGLSPNAFTRDAEGDYSFVIDSTAMEPGQYHVVITVSDGPAKVSILTDTFVLRQI